MFIFVIIINNYKKIKFELLVKVKYDVPLEECNLAKI